METVLWDIAPIGILTGLRTMADVTSCRLTVHYSLTGMADLGPDVKQFTGVQADEVFASVKRILDSFKFLK
jgi:hypothetical protein